MSGNLSGAAGGATNSTYAVDDQLFCSDAGADAARAEAVLVVCSRDKTAGKPESSGPADASTGASVSTVSKGGAAN